MDENWRLLCLDPVATHIIQTFGRKLPELAETETTAPPEIVQRRLSEVPTIRVRESSTIVTPKCIYERLANLRRRTGRRVCRRDKSKSGKRLAHTARSAVSALDRENVPNQEKRSRQVAGVAPRRNHDRRRAMKSALRWSKASGSTKRRVEKIIRLGERAAKRSLSARHRREFVERLDYAK